MRQLTLIVCASLLLCGSVGVPAYASDDDEYEEVVVRRKKKKQATTAAEQPATVAPSAAVVPTAAVIVPAVVTVPVAAPSAPVSAVADEVEGEPPPPPEPPRAEAAEPRRLVRYFCKVWKDKDWERLWWAMSPKYRKKVSLKKFTKLFESDAEMNGGLLDENIIETGKSKDGNEAVKVELTFKFPKARHRFVMAVVERQSGGAFRVVESPIIPQDLDDL